MKYVQRPSGVLQAPFAMLSGPTRSKRRQGHQVRSRGYRGALKGGLREHRDPLLLAGFLEIVTQTGNKHTQEQLGDDSFKHLWSHHILFLCITEDLIMAEFNELEMSTRICCHLV